MTAGDDVVLPTFTNIGEPTCASTEGSTSSTDATVIYSSIPPDINMDSMSRATKSSVVGEMLRVSKTSGGKLSIFACEPSDGSSTSVYDRGQSSICVVCHRTIADREMFLNFPDDLDRRRLWGNMLGFKYSDMLRLRDGSVVLSTGNICTDHFSEECFRVFNFNKAAIEALGMPSIVSPDVRLTPSKKWIPWDCTVCSFQSHSVFAMQRHMVEHTDDVLLRYHPKSPRGLLCPFCRKCTYGYKTMSGLRRHLMTPPVQHCQLKRIFEIARVNCRSSLLEPSMKWSSWTDRNVYVAYHGCEPPPRTPRKRPSSAALELSELSEDNNDGSDSATAQDLTISEGSQLIPKSPPEMPTLCSSVCRDKNLIQAQITPPLTPTVPSSSSSASASPVLHSSSNRPIGHKNPRRSLFFASPVKRDANGQAKPILGTRPVLQLRKPLLPSDVVKPSDNRATSEKTSNEMRRGDDEKCRTVAKIILKDLTCVLATGILIFIPPPLVLDGARVKKGADSMPHLPVMILNAITSEHRERWPFCGLEKHAARPHCSSKNPLHDNNLWSFLDTTSVQHQTLADALNLMSAEQEGETLSEDPALAKPLFLDNDSAPTLNASGFSFTQESCATKTRRQLESVEARIRLFGDCSRVEVPSGYTTVETQSGVRLVEGNSNVHDMSSTPICLPRGRFVPVSHR
ncbi:hypothetical protein Y032_0547g3268 [Ancylostoma ceylanicum]|uniref:THAP-type domain-containing protein n=1 Tax=Ancylostoma ceylanicum TaxID=53326 RepID=A0A016WRW2_9BILA|nr:hypothetical protein Y032_0547g3268 [Ancylostoma ceylanicum]